MDSLIVPSPHTGSSRSACNIERIDVLKDASARDRPLAQGVLPAKWNTLVALYCEDEKTRPHVHRILRRHVEFVQAPTFEALAALVRDVSCSVLVIRRAVPVDEFAFPMALRTRHPLHPLVIVRDVSAQDARGLARSCRDEVVPLRNSERELGPAVIRACLAGALEQLASVIETHGEMRPRLRAALALACRARPPIRSVKELAAEVGCESRTLEHHWRTAVPRVRGLRLHDLLGWILILHASAARLEATSWTAASAELGVCPHTLARLTRILADLSLQEVAALGSRQTIFLFSQTVLPKLLGRCAV